MTDNFVSIAGVAGIDYHGPFAFHDECIHETKPQGDDQGRGHLLKGTGHHDIPILAQSPDEEKLKLKKQDPGDYQGPHTEG